MKSILTAIAILFTFNALADDALDSANAQIAKLQAEVDRDNKIIKAMEKFALVPVKVERRKAMTGDGYVIMFSNQSAKMLPVKIHMENPGLGTSKDLTLVLPPANIISDVHQIGYKEGWTGAPGDTIKIESQGFIPVNNTWSDQ